MAEYVNAFAALSAALLFVFGTLLLLVASAVMGVAAWWFASAVRAAHTARAHGAQADATTTVVSETQRALDELPPRTQLLPDFTPPTDDELRDLIRDRRRTYTDENDYTHEYTTSGNEGVPDEPPIPPINMYRGLGDA